MLKIKIEMEFTYNEKALETVKKAWEEYCAREGYTSLNNYLDMNVDDMLFVRFKDYECIDGEDYKIKWAIEEK